MKITTRKVYTCDHCKRNMISASAMSRHEKFCRYNPTNRHKCFDNCIHLERKRILIEGHDPFSRYSYKTIFRCKVNDWKMYSYLLKKTGNFRTEYLEGLIQMPLQCIDFREMNESEYDKRYNPESL